MWSAEGSVARWTGRDLEDDGLPEAVIGHDPGGGNRCCWRYAVLRLTPRFAVAAELAFLPIVSPPGERPTTIREIVPFYALGPSMADAPIIVRIHRFRDGMLHDRLEASRTATAVVYEIGETRVAARSVAMQHLFCNADEEAVRIVRLAWPGDAVSHELALLRTAVAGIR